MFPAAGASDDHALPLSLLPGTMETYHRWPCSVDAPCYLVGGLIYPHRGGPGVSAMLVSRAGVLLSARVRSVSSKLADRIKFNDLNCSDSTSDEFERRREVWHDSVGGWRFFESGISAVPIGIELLRSLEFSAALQWAEARDCLDLESTGSKELRNGALELTGPDARLEGYLVSTQANPLAIEPLRPPTSVVEEVLNSLEGQPRLQRFMLDQLVLGSDARLIDELLLLRPEAAANFLRERSHALLKQLLAFVGQPQSGSFHKCIATLAEFVNQESVPYLREIDRRGHKPYRELGARLQSVLLGMVADLERVRDVGNSGSHGVPVGSESVRIQQAAWTSFESKVDEMVSWVSGGLGRVW